MFGSQLAKKSPLHKAFVANSDGLLQIVRVNDRFRALLRYQRTGRLIAVLLGRYEATSKGEPRWMMSPHYKEHHRVTVLVLLNAKNSAIEQLRIVASVGSHKFALRENSECLQKAIALEHPSQLVDAVNRVRRLK